MKRNIVESIWNRANRNGLNDNFYYIFERLYRFTDYIKSSVQTFNDLPTNDPINTLRAVLDENKIYRFTGAKWELFQYIDLSLVGNLESKLEILNQVYRTKKGTTGSEDAVNTLIGYKDNAIVSGIRGAHVQQGSKFNENVIGGYPETIGEYAKNEVNPNITNAHYSAVGGYDNVVNALASLVYSMHSYVHEQATHGSIFGGSYNQILDGDYSSIFGGTINLIDANDGGAYSAIVGGNRGSIYGKFGTIIGGFQNRIGSAANNVHYSGIYGSQLSTVDGNYASVVNGIECKSTKDYSYSRGKGAVANNVGENAFSTGKFKTAGDSGQSTMHLMRQTDTGFETQLLLDDGTSSIITPVGVNTILKIRGSIVGFRVDAEGGASFGFTAVLYRGGGGLEVKSLSIDRDWSSDALYDMNVKVNTANNSYQILAKGVSGHTINWTGKLETVWSRSL